MIKEWKQIHITCYQNQLIDAGKTENSLSRVAFKFLNTKVFQNRPKSFSATEMSQNRIKFDARHSVKVNNQL